MKLEDWIKWLEIQNYDSKVILNGEQSLQILGYLKELQKYKHIFQQEIGRFIS